MNSVLHSFVQIQFGGVILLTDEFISCVAGHLMAGSTPSSITSQIASRDHNAFTEFVLRYEQIMLRTAYRIVGNISDAHEIRQSVLMQIWQRPEQLPNDDLLDPWLRRCVINASISQLRASQRRVSREENSARPEIEETENDRTSEAERLQGALRRLPPHQRALLSLRFDDDLTIRQIATVLEKPHTTVQSQLKQTIAELRRQLSPGKTIPRQGAPHD